MTPRGALGRTSRVLLGVLVLAAALALLLLPREAGAQAGERIRDYRVEYTIQPSGDLLVRERIAYDFGMQQRRGIFRDIVTSQRYDDDHDRRYLLSEVTVRAESPDTPVQVHEESEGALTRFRIGDPDREITGEHVYLIEYRLRGALNAFEQHDELYWNAISGWQVPIERAHVTVHAPATIADVGCFAGPVGSSLPCDVTDLAASSVTFEEAALASGGAFTIVVALPKGIVDEPVPILEVRHTFERAFTISPGRIAAALALFVVTTGAVVRLAWRRGRDRHWQGQPVAAIVPADTEGREETRVPLGGLGAYPVEYTPPKELRPGLIGTLLDETAHPLDVTATIIDLAARGYLRIEEVEQGGLLKIFAKDDWRLVRRKPSDDLATYERILLYAVFEDGDEVLLSDLRGSFATHLGKVQDELYAELIQRGWYHHSPRDTRNLWLGLGIGALVAAVALVVLVGVFTTYAIVPLGLVPAAIMLLATHTTMPSRTARGTMTYRRVLGFRRFILDAETYRARFAEQAGLFYDYLPYAVVFGATKQWARAFQDLDLPAPDWYRSSQAFTAAALVNSMSSFSDHSSGALSYTPGSSGSSGFGGGGFSGGGGGGGGGGSW